MDKQIIERAVEVAAKANFDRYTDHPHGDAWEETPEQVKAIWRGGVTEPVTAALAEVEAPIKAQALREYADATRHPWTVFRRDDGSPVTVNDLMRETADRIEAGVPRG